MNTRVRYWRSTLLAISSTICLPLSAQQEQTPEADIFMQAVQKDQQEQAARAAAEKMAQKAMQGAQADEITDDTVASPEAYLTRPGADVTAATDEELERAIGGSTGVMSRESQYDGQKVASVEVRYVSGHGAVPKQRLLDIVRTRAGSKYESDVVSDDLMRLVERGLVDADARVAVEPTGKGLRVIFEVRPADVMAGVGFRGNKRFTSEELMEHLTEATDAPVGAVPLRSGQTFNDKGLAAAKAQIQQMYYEAGYPDTKVTWHYAGTARSGYRDVIFDITEGRNVTMDHIHFVGNKEFDSVQLRQVMQTKERGLFTWFTKSGRIDRERVQDDLEEIVRLYRDHGYLRAAITKVEYSSPGNATGPQRLTMRVHINEGPRYRVRNVSFKGISVYTPQELHPGLSMLDGDIYSLQKVTDDTRMIRDYYGAKGYADATVRPDVDEVGVDASGLRLVDICYEVSEGSPYKVGRINIAGNTKTQQHVILRELPLKPGRPLNSVDVETARKRLENLNYFHDGIEVSQSASGTPGYRDINVVVREKETGQVQFGVAFSSIENVYLYATSTQTNFDLGGFLDGNFVGAGQRLTVTGRLGTETQSAVISFVEPWFLDRKLALGLEMYYSDNNYLSDYYTQQNYGFNVSLRKALNDAHNLRLTYTLEQYSLDPESGYVPPFFRDNCGDFTRSNIRLAYEYDTRNSVVIPRKGGNFEAFGSWSGPGSTVETYSVGIGGSYYYNSKWDSIWSVNFGAQTVDTVDSNEEVPLFERCFLGGPNNLRGFRFHDVGLVDPALSGDESMGGKTSAFAQLEVTLPVVDSMRFAAFVDVGFVNGDSFDFDTSHISADYGIGLRINLPMGPMAVDYAIPFKTGNAVDRNGQFQFYLDYKY